MAEYIYPEPQQWRRRKVVGPMLGQVFKGEVVPTGDLRVESDAEVLFDATEALPRITVPTLVISAQEDMFFDPEAVVADGGRDPGRACHRVRGDGSHEGGDEFATRAGRAGVRKGTAPASYL